MRSPCGLHRSGALLIPAPSQVIKGWDIAILGSGELPPMHVGGVRSLKLPAELAYGSKGAGCRGGECIIPPDTQLSFVIQLKEVRPTVVTD